MEVVKVLETLTKKLVRDVASEFSNCFLLACRRLVRFNAGKMKPVILELFNTKNILSQQGRNNPALLF